MGAGHNHGAPTTEAGAPGDHRARLWIAFGLTATIVIAQAIGSIVTGSLALLTDTAHAITDASGLLVALIAATLMLRPANPKRTWGFRRIEVIAALGQAALLLVVGTYAAVEGIRRLFEPPEVAAGEMLVFGIVGLAANVIAIVILSSSRGANFNMRAAFLEVINDALGSLGVIVAAIVIATTGFQQADAIAGLLIAGLIVPRAITLLREVFAVLGERAPEGTDVATIREHILSADGVADVHDVHVWQLTRGAPVFTAHVVVEPDVLTSGRSGALLSSLQSCLAEHFDVEHSTFQFEPAGHTEHEAH